VTAKCHGRRTAKPTTPEHHRPWLRCIAQKAAQSDQTRPTPAVNQSRPHRWLDGWRHSQRRHCVRIRRKHALPLPSGHHTGCLKSVRLLPSCHGPCFGLGFLAGNLGNDHSFNRSDPRRACNKLRAKVCAIGQKTVARNTPACP